MAIEENEAPHRPGPQPPPKPIPASDAITTDDGDLTLWQWVQKLKNIKISTHAFAGIAATATTVYLTTPELQDIVKNAFLTHPKALVVIGTAVTVWRNYTKVQKNATITTTIVPGEAAVSGGVAAAGTEVK